MLLAMPEPGQTTNMTFALASIIFNYSSYKAAVIAPSRQFGLYY